MDKGIYEQIAELEAYMDDAVQWIPDIAPEFSGVDGMHVYSVPEDEFEAKCHDYDRLTDLINLRNQPCMGYCEGGSMCHWTGEQIARYEAYMNDSSYAIG